jgi:hypothetical protein
MQPGSLTPGNSIWGNGPHIYTVAVHRNKMTFQGKKLVRGSELHLQISVTSQSNHFMCHFLSRSTWAQNLVYLQIFLQRLVNWTSNCKERMSQCSLWETELFSFNLNLSIDHDCMEQEIQILFTYERFLSRHRQWVHYRLYVFYLPQDPWLSFMTEWNLQQKRYGKHCAKDIYMNYVSTDQEGR